jgi:Flp pilus assembly protein protease CpaA
MAYRPRGYSKTGVFFISLLLGIATAHALFETPNVVGGGDAKLVASLVLMIVWKVIIEYFLGRWQKRRAEKQVDKSAGS